MKMKMVSEESVERAIESAIDLISHLKKIRSGRKTEANPTQDLLNILVGRIEDGEKFEVIVDEIDRMILLTLISRGNDTSEKLAKVMGKQPSSIRQILFTRKISLRKLKKTKRNGADCEKVTHYKSMGEPQKEIKEVKE